MPDWSVTLLCALLAAVTSVPVWNTISRLTGRGATEIDRLRLEVRGLKEEHETCQREVTDLKARIAVVEHHHASHFARWIRDAHKRILWANTRALLSIFAPLGYSKLDEVEGKAFGDIFDHAATKEIELLDQAALSNPGGTVSALIRLHPDLPLMHIVSVAAAGREGEVIYEGIAFRANDPVIAASLGIIRQAEQRIESLDHLTDPRPD